MKWSFCSEVIFITVSVSTYIQLFAHNIIQPDTQIKPDSNIPGQYITRCLLLIFRNALLSLFNVMQIDAGRCNYCIICNPWVNKLFHKALISRFWLIIYLRPVSQNRGYVGNRVSPTLKLNLDVKHRQFMLKQCSVDECFKMLLWTSTIYLSSQTHLGPWTTFWMALA